MTGTFAPQDEREKLALRARGRREQIGLSRSVIALQLGITAATLVNWERSLPRNTSRDSDWEDALLVHHGWLRDTSSLESDVIPILQSNDKERARLGMRARQQRELLGLTRSDISSKLKVAQHTFNSWERKLPKSTALDAAWEDALKVPAGWLRSSNAEIVEINNHFVPSAEGSATLSTTLLELFTWFVEENQFKRTLDYSSLSQTQRRDVAIMLQRYGIRGDDASTLQAIGDEFKISKERVRQITERVIESAKQEHIRLPVIDSIKEVIDGMLPSRTSTITANLEHLLGESFTLESADRFAREILGESIVKMEPGTGIYAGVGEKIAMPTLLDDVAVKVIRQISLAMIRATGAAQVFFVAGAASQELERGVTPSEVIQYCSIWANFEWLEERDGWYWFGASHDNRAVSCAMKVLSIANRNVDIEEIQAAMTRSRVRYEADKARPFMINAPTMVLQKVLSHASQIEILQYNDFRLKNSHIDREEYEDAYLSESELACLEVIREHGGITTRKALYSELVEERGMVPMTFHTVLDSSPIMHRLDSGIWTLAGTKIDPINLLRAVTKMMTESERSMETSD